ncbi:Spc97/Spc98 [Penicillium bovifimosum]|uniref:Spindle pole body component n=1 Tax=Penicillium bovifimosum TaxID=126998 RepID=A0A9W9KUP2_9EURO|nr:Spc97/Spc98 [Penicillium bovifimosum]KAJ5121656.1 Spc97/Spc98 [Penicillium bovifimosum]
MLHEILLSLSGQPSPLFDSKKGEDAITQDAFPLLSPPEKALLASIAHLSRLHTQLREYTSEISSTNPSVICRSVSTAIVGIHLSEFQKKILEVESAILAEDSGYVGGYGIVPLSTIVGEFAPWTRRMEWLWGVIRFIQTERKTNERPHGSTGAALIDHLRTEALTGYLDIKEMALQLATAAETAWMKQLSMWLLYGNLPMYGRDDFFIQDATGPENDEVKFRIDAHLLPKFVTAQTAGSILFIGKSLNHIRAKRKTSIAGTSTAPVTLYRDHIEQLAGVRSPISPSKLTSVIDCIRLSLSQSTLSKLLPLPRILEILTLLHNFLLLGRGEFAVALVAHADSRIEESRHRSLAAIRSSGKFDGLSIREGDVNAALVQTWAELSSLQKEEDPADEELELARELLCLSISGRKNARPMTPAQVPNPISDISRVSFEDLLFPTPTHLSAQIRAPLDLFISSSDIAIYSKIHSYLLAIRRAHIRLGDLWKRTPLRRNHPTPWGPPRSNSKFGQAKLQARRDRDNARLRRMRPIWATGSACLFMLSEIGSFFQGDVVNESWHHLRQWIEGHSSSTSSAPGSRPSTASSSKPHENSNLAPSDGMPVKDSTDSGRTGQQTMGRHDPEALTVAHRRHLSSLVHSLFLTELPFTNTLRGLLTNIDRFVALVIRLETIQRKMDLETDEGVEDALVDYAQEEREVWEELRATHTDVETALKNLVGSLRNIDDSRSGEGRGPADLATNTGHMWPGSRQDETMSSGFSHYMPHKTAGVDRLLMKLDFGSLRSGFGPEATGGLASM